MQGGTTFYFVHDGIEAALEQAFNAADGNDVRVGGGASTVQQYLRAGLIDDMHLVIVPILLGSGERLFDHLDGGPDGYDYVEFISSPSVAHVRFSVCRNRGRILTLLLKNQTDGPLLDVAEQLHPERAVVVGRSGASIDL